MKIDQINKWILAQRKKNLMKSNFVNASETLNWVIDAKKITHKKKAFFSIVPFSFEDSDKNKWSQPLIIQKEIGILGIIKKKIKNIDYYLLQAKIEPGNKNGMQLSPTVQATRSNYLRKHGGKKTNYLNFFQKKKLNIRVLSDLKLSEQGTRYLEKSNRNILININNQKITKFDNYIWLTKKNLEYLIKKRNLLNMDTISVLSSSIKKNKHDIPLTSISALNKKINFFKNNYKIKKKKVSFIDLKDWRIFKNKLTDIKKKFFSILFLKINTNSREISNWYQPILSDHSISYNGFLIKKKNKTSHYLMQIVHEPGFFKPKLTSTIAIKNYNKKLHNKKIEYIEYFINKKNVIQYINSDEGGRFYKNETRNSIFILKKNDDLKLSKNFIWVSHNQIINLINRNLLTIEARNLFASFNIDKIN